MYMPASDACPTGIRVDPFWSGNILFMKLAHEKFSVSMVILSQSFSPTDIRRAIVSVWWENVHKYWLTT